MDLNLEKKISFVYELSETKTTTFAGGKPFINDDFVYPVDDSGKAMSFLFQADLSHVDKDVKEYYNLPDKGFLQFYHGANDRLGIDWDNEDLRNNISKIVFLDEAFNKDFDFPSIVNDEYTPLWDFDKRTYYLGKTIHMNPAPGTNDFLDEYDVDYEKYADYYYDHLNECYEFYLGGFPHFAQSDIRTEENNLEMFLGSDSGDKIMWGDGGFGAFFLDKKDFKSQNYDNSIIWWDCS